MIVEKDRLDKLGRRIQAFLRKGSGMTTPKASASLNANALVQRAGFNGGTHLCAYDGNGNKVALASLLDGSPTALYEYGLPHMRDEPIRVSGPAALMNPFRFSIKRTCNTTDLLLYEDRVFNSSMGKWPNRDPWPSMAG